LDGTYYTSSWLVRRRPSHSFFIRDEILAICRLRENQEKMVIHQQ
jgi:hypothetical protein